MLDLLYPDFRVRMRRIFDLVKSATGLTMRPTETLRSFERQEELYRRGRELRNGVWVVSNRALIVTKAPPGFSVHAYGLACDACFQGSDPYLEKLPKRDRDQAWKAYGYAAQAYGCRWGGDWNGNGVEDANDFDKPHVELTYGLRLTDLLELYNYGGVIAVWSHIDKRRGVPVASEWKLDEKTPILEI